MGLGDPRHLVFTSAGDEANLHHWFTGPRDFDVWIAYYGDRPGRYRELADHYTERKGAKFPNLHHVYQDRPEIIGAYDAVLVIDDDVIIRSEAINALFTLRERYDLWALQPAFDRRGKISHPITRRHVESRLRFTNFIEMTCPLFRADKLASFMQEYDPELVGWGVDFWFLHHMGPDLERHVAIADDIPCINPHDVTKTHGREIDRLQSVAERRANFERLRKSRGISRGGSNDLCHLTYGSVDKSPLRAWVDKLAEQVSYRLSRLTLTQLSKRRSSEAGR